MNQEQLRTFLEDLRPTARFSIGHDDYADIFPPGEPDEGAREACYNFAKSSGCRIENDQSDKKIWFVKE